MRRSDLLRAVALFLGATGMAMAQTPSRVVSMNLCTDQMAMLIAPETLIAIDPISRDPVSSAMVEEAAAIPVHSGAAEDIFLLAPDLVLAGSYSERATVDMLRRLGVRVEEFTPPTSLDEMRAQMRRMGALLGRPQAAADLLAEFDAALANLRQAEPSRIALPYFANGYSVGRGTMVNDILSASGLRNATADDGVSGGANVPLERVVMVGPDLIVTGQRYPAASRAEAILDHPALVAATQGGEILSIPDRDWICGTPHILQAITRLTQAARALP